MPALYYTFTSTIPFSTQTVQFVMLDTSSLTGGDAGQVDSAPPSSPQPPIDEAQWAWVTATLAGSSADWIIVVGHFPVYSGGENGNTPLLVERLLPLMESAGVALYISGHDHQLEHIAPVQVPTPLSVDFIVTGAGAKYNESDDHADDVPAGTLKYQYGAGCGFASVYVSREGWAPSLMSVTLWGSSGNVLYTFSKPNPRLRFMPPAPPRPPHPPNQFATKSNKIAVIIGMIGLFGGCVVIFGGLASGLSGPSAPPPQARAAPPRPPSATGGAAAAAGGASSNMERCAFAMRFCLRVLALRCSAVSFCGLCVLPRR
jgi:hypothetical protein